MKDVMDAKLSRRRFLKTAPPAAGMLAYAGQGAAPANPAPQTKRKSSDVTLSGTAYTPVPDYPIQPKRYSEVTVKDTFWKPKITTNAEVTIPFEVQKIAESASARGFGGGVLEAAILSLQTHPDAQLQAKVDARIERWRQASASGNSGFEIAATYYPPRGKGICWTMPSRPPARYMKTLSCTILRSPEVSGTPSTVCNSIV